MNVLAPTAADNDVVEFQGAHLAGGHAGAQHQSHSGPASVLLPGLLRSGAARAYGREIGDQCLGFCNWQEYGKWILVMGIGEPQLGTPG